MWPHSSPRQLFHFFLTRLHILLSRWWCLNSLWFSSAEMRLMLTFPRIMNDTVHQSQAKILGALNFKDVKSLNPAQGLWTGLVKFYKPLSPFHRLLRGELPPELAPTLLYHPRVCNRGERGERWLEDLNSIIGTTIVDKSNMASFDVTVLRLKVFRHKHLRHYPWFLCLVDTLSGDSLESQLCFVRLTFVGCSLSWHDFAIVSEGCVCQDEYYSKKKHHIMNIYSL